MLSLLQAASIMAVAKSNILTNLFMFIAFRISFNNYCDFVLSGEEVGFYSSHSE